MSSPYLVPAATAAGLLAIGPAAAGYFIGKGVTDFQLGDRNVTVRGLSEREVKADSAVLALTFVSAGNDLSEIQADIDGDLATTRKFLAQRGFGPGEIDLGGFTVTDQFARDYQPNEIRARYRVAQTVIVRTKNVDRVQATSRALDGLVRQGVVLQDYNGPSYIFTKLNSVRGPMIAEATASARTGAQQFARDSGSQLMGISSATQGSFEILGRDEVGDEGSQVFKKVRVVTTVTYRLR